MWANFIQVAIVVDLAFTLFFHIIQLRSFCCQKNALCHLGTRFNCVESKLNHVEYRTRRIHESISERGLGASRDSEEREEVDSES